MLEWRRRCVAGLAIIAASVCLLAGLTAKSTQAQSPRNAESVYRIFTIARAGGTQQQGQNNQSVLVGTGFLVSGRRILLTNNHVVSVTLNINGQNVQPAQTNYFIGVVRNGAAVTIPARVVATLPAKDLAILEASEDLPGSALTIADYDPALQIDVEAIGFPAIADRPIQAGRRNMDNVSPAELLPTRTNGRIQRLFDVENLPINGAPAPLTLRVVQHTASFSGGNSGGPLINRCDQVLGINTFTWTSNQGGAIALQSVSSIEAARFLRAQNVQFRSASRFCLLPGTASDYITFPAVTGIFATLLGLAALILAARKPQVIRETVSRVQNSFSRANRRPSGSSVDGGWDQIRAGRAGESPPEPRPAAAPRGDAIVRLVPSDGSPAVEILVRRLSGGRAAVVGRSREYLQEQNPSDHPVVLGDKSISRRHAKLTLDDRGRLTVEDLGSSAGTFKGDRKVDIASFSDGESVRFGAVSYRVVLPT